jgi:hypothetical protein
MISNILSATEITELFNDPIVNINKEKLSTLQQVDFSIQVSDTIKTKLESGLAIPLSQTIPMRWIKGDTPPHTDRGEKQFTNTYLVYLTDSSGHLIVDGQAYPIAAGDAHIFNEGLEHSTINTENSVRLMIGPISESGFRVGGPISGIYYYDNRTDASNNENVIDTSGYQLITVNGISAWIVYSNVDGTDPSPNGGPYNTGFTLNETGVYNAYPYIAPPPFFNMRSLFTNNAQVYYKPHSLSTGSGGSGVRNSSHKKHRT